MHKKYNIITYGCQMNESDSERLATKLESQGYLPICDYQKADLVVINVCSVRQSAVNRVYSKVAAIRSAQPKTKLILTGCLIEKDIKRLSPTVDGIQPFAGLEITPKLSSQHRALVPIMTGCNNFCSYCVVPYTRGRERSRQACNILRDVKKFCKQGCQDITLLGQNVNSYCHLNVDFPTLLQKVQEIPGDFKVGFMTSHPKDMSDKLISVIAGSDKIKKEIHLPIQSGNNAILKKMNRGYTVAKYRKLIGKIRHKIPDAMMSTDVIVGFPGETEKQFQDTVDLLKEINFNQIYVAAYSPRTGTAASKIKDDVPSYEKKRRKKIILKMIEIKKS